MGSYLNPGNFSFRGSLRFKIYVDKSELIAKTNEALCTEQKYICVSRPRRFGKSMAANMLAAYYDRSELTEELFQKLSISRDCDNLLTYIHKKQPGKKFMTGFRIVSALAVFLGAGMEMTLLWHISDVLMGVMALINIPVILILSNTVLKALKDYEGQIRQKKNPVFFSKNIDLKQKTDYWNEKTSE